jgi:hypothetical protein
MTSNDLEWPLMTSNGFRHQVQFAFLKLMEDAEVPLLPATAQAGMPPRLGRPSPLVGHHHPGGGGGATSRREEEAAILRTRRVP